MPREVLLIDDDPFVGPLLEGRGFGLTVAKSGGAGLLLLAQRPFDVVLLALHLPDMPGLEVLSRIKDGRAAPPVVVMSGGGPGSAEAQEAMRLGAAGQFETEFPLPVPYAEVCRVLRLPPA